MNCNCGKFNFCRENGHDEWLCKTRLPELVHAVCLEMLLSFYVIFTFPCDSQVLNFQHSLSYFCFILIYLCIYFWTWSCSLKCITVQGKFWLKLTIIISYSRTTENFWTIRVIHIKNKICRHYHFYDTNLYSLSYFVSNRR